MAQINFMTTVDRENHMSHYTYTITMKASPMAYTKPNIHNLRKRAKVLGLQITKQSTPEDIAMFGFTEYTINPIGEDTDHCDLMSLDGIHKVIKDTEDMFDHIEVESR